MLKFFFIAVLTVCGGQSFAAQTPQPPGSSESAIYQPRKLEEQASKKKKEKSSKKKTEEERKNETGKLPETKTDSLVRIPVFVYDAQGNPFKNLKAEDFRLSIDNSEREIVKVENEIRPLDLLLLVDTSPSTAYEPQQLKNFVTKLTQALKPQDKIQIISFNSEVKVLNEATNDPETIKKAIKKLEMGDGTSIYETIETIFQKHAGDGGKTVILLTDGVDTTSRKADYASSLIEAEKGFAPVFPFYLYTFGALPKSSSVRILPGILGGSFPNRPPLGGAPAGATKEDYERGLNFVSDLAVLSGGRAFQIKNLADTKTDEIARILESLVPHYFISFKPPAEAASGLRKPFQVIVNRPNLKIQTRGSFIAQ